MKIIMLIGILFATNAIAQDKILVKFIQCETENECLMKLQDMDEIEDSKMSYYAEYVEHGMNVYKVKK